MDPERRKVVPGEAVGTVSAQSIGEPGTQMSLGPREEIMVKIDGRIRMRPIGDFVDQLIGQYGSKELNETEICDLPSQAGVEVPSLNEEGKVEWKKLLSCSRHNCSRKLLHIKTRSGRKITATDNHSFVIRKNNKIVPVVGKELKVKDRIPVIKNLPLPEPQETLEMSHYLPKDEWWYGSELNKALLMNDGGSSTSYIIPAGAHQLRNYRKGNNTFQILEGFVYPYQIHSKAKIPEQFSLDSKLGWFLGAYLSEGSVSRYRVSISNTEKTFLSRVRGFARTFEIGYQEEDNYRGFAKGHDIEINSRVLVEFLQKTCGKGSHEKKVPEFAYSAPEAFVGSLLRGYFDGDGNISVERRVIRVSSRSKKLIDGIALLLSRLGIFATKSDDSEEYRLSISYKYAKKFKEKIGLDSPHKAKSLDKLCQIQPSHSYDVVEMIPGIGSLLKELAKKVGLPIRFVNNFTKRQRIGRASLKKYTGLFERKAREKGIDISEKLALLRQMLREDVVWDEIVEIQYVKPEQEKVYDLSVEGLETFTTTEGVVTHNTLRTFHYAGVVEVAVPLGLPRLIEIVDARRSPKNPMMTIYLKKKHSQERKKAEEIAERLREKFFREVAEIKIDIGKKELKVNTKDKDAQRLLKKISQKTDDNKFVIKKKSLGELKKLMDKLEKKRLSGVKDIRRVFVRELDEEWVIYTEGSNLKTVLNKKYVDSTRTTTNDLQQIYKTLGVEAARKGVVKEAKEVLEDQGLDVDIRHIMLVADRMCISGEMQAVGRTGVSGDKESVLARAAFEETEKHILNAALYGEVDNLDGVAENIIIGQPIPVGTGTVELKVKEEVKRRRKEKAKRKRKKKKTKKKGKKKSKKKTKKKKPQGKYAKILDGTIKEVKKKIEKLKGPQYKTIKRIEKRGKNRKTLQKWLDKKMEEGK